MALCAAALAALGLMPATSPAAAPRLLESASRDGSGTAGNDEAFASDVSDEGRFIAFRSAARNLVPTTPRDCGVYTSPGPVKHSHPCVDVFVFDRGSRTVERVSVDSAGREVAGDGASVRLSGDGRIVVFSSEGKFDGNDTNAGAYPAADWGQDVFVHDRDTGVTERLSAGVCTKDPSGPATCSYGAQPTMSRDGSLVVYLAYTLVYRWNDTVWACVGSPRGPYRNSCLTEEHLVVHDRRTGERRTIGLEYLDRLPVISPDGRRLATWCDHDDTNATTCVYDVATGTKLWQIVGTPYAFSGDAALLVISVTDSGLTGSGNPQILVRNLAAETFVVASGGAQGIGNSGSYDPAIARDGRAVAFRSCASNLVPGDTNARCDVFVRDLVAGTIVRESVSDAGTEGDNHSSLPALSADGSTIAFSSSASNLIAGDTNGRGDVLVRGPDVYAPHIPAITTPGAHEVVRTLTFPIGGFADAGTTVTLSKDTSVLGTAVADAARRWQTQISLPVGTHEIEAVATDGEGTPSLVAPRTIVVGKAGGPPYGAATTDEAICPDDLLLGVANTEAEADPATGRLAVTAFAQDPLPAGVFAAGRCVGAVQATADGRFLEDLPIQGAGRWEVTATFAVSQAWTEGRRVGANVGFTAGYGTLAVLARISIVGCEAECAPGSDPSGGTTQTTLSVNGSAAPATVTLSLVVSTTDPAASAIHVDAGLYAAALAQGAATASAVGEATLVAIALAAA